MVETLSGEDGVDPGDARGLRGKGEASPSLPEVLLAFLRGLPVVGHLPDGVDFLVAEAGRHPASLLHLGCVLSFASSSAFAVMFPCHTSLEPTWRIWPGVTLLQPLPS